MDNRQHELSGYRLQEAEDSLKVAQNCLSDGFYKDSINRSYYAAKSKAEEQIETAAMVLQEVKNYLLPRQ